MSVFRTSLSLPEDYRPEDLDYSKTVGWDSVAHMNLIMEIEEAFDIMIDVEEIGDMSNFKAAQKILDTHGIED